MSEKPARDAMAEKREWDFQGCSVHNLMADRHCGDCRLVRIGMLDERIHALESELQAAQQGFASADAIAEAERQKREAAEARLAEAERLLRVRVLAPEAWTRAGNAGWIESVESYFASSSPAPAATPENEHRLKARLTEGTEANPPHPESPSGVLPSPPVPCNHRWERVDDLTVRCKWCGVEDEHLRDPDDEHDGCCEDR